MVDITFLKNDGYFVADDYQSLERASGRLRELAVDGTQEIRRNRGNGLEEAPSVEAVLMAASTYEAALADIETNAKPSISTTTQKQIDDDLGRHITSYMDLIQGNSQAKAGLYGTTNAAYANFEFYNSDTTRVDNRDSSLPDFENFGDVLMGAMLHPDVANYLANVGSLSATTYSGTGDGTIAVSLKSGSVAETITVTAAGGGPGATFAVVGSISGALGNVVSGAGETDLGVICLDISDGAADYVATDEFTVTSVAI